MRAFIGVALLFSSSIALGAVSAQKLAVDPATSAATFQAVGKPGFLKINGTGSKVTGGCDGDVCAFEADLTTLATGIDMRDEHMKEKYLETGKYPKATLKVKPLAATGNTTGSLTLHGVTKDVPIHAVVTKQAGGESVVATMKLKLTDFGLQIPSYMGVTVAEDVTVQASFMLNPVK